MAGTVDTGRDTHCLDSLVTGRLARGKMLLGQRCYHRLITPAGTLRGGEDEANFGRDLAGFIGSTNERQLVSMLPVIVKNELLKDPAIDAVDVAAERVEVGGLVSWTLVIKIDATDGEVELIVSVSSVTVELLGIR